MPKYALPRQGDRRKIQKLPKPHLIDLGRDRAMLQQRLHLRGKIELTAHLCVIKRLYTKAISCKKDRAVTLIVHGKGKNAIEIRWCRIPPNDIRPKHRFGITFGKKHRALRL